MEMQVLYIGNLASRLLQIGHELEKWQWHHNIITGSGVMRIFFCKRLTRNLGVENTPVCVLLNIWRLGQARNTNFGMYVSNEMILNAAKWQGYSLYRF